MALILAIAIAFGIIVNTGFGPDRSGVVSMTHNWPIPMFPD